MSDIRPRATAEEKYTNNFCQYVQKHCREKERKEKENCEDKCKTYPLTSKDNKFTLIN